MWMWKAIDIEFMAMKGIDISEEGVEAFQDDIEGMGFTETAVFFKERFNIKDSIEEIKNTWVLMSEDKYCNEVPLKPGALELLQELKKRNIPVGISSSNTRELIMSVLKAQKVEAYFSCITTCCDVPAGKPAPDVYLKTAAQMQVDPKDCLVFEDVPMGILAGKRAGMKVCAVDDVFSRKQEAEKRKLADWYIQDYFEVLETMKEASV